METLTAADYSVEFNIDPEMFATFKQHLYDETNPISEIGQFKLYIKDEMEVRLTEFPGLGYGGEEEDMADIKIAKITFAFKNYKVINELNARGYAINNEDYKLLDHINRHVIEHLAHTGELLDDL